MKNPYENLKWYLIASIYINNNYLIKVIGVVNKLFYDGVYRNNKVIESTIFMDNG